MRLIQAQYLRAGNAIMFHDGMPAEVVASVMPSGKRDELRVRVKTAKGAPKKFYLYWTTERLTIR